MNPLTHILLRLFARGFYKAHAGMFLYFFTAVFIYFFFINVLNQTHLPPSERVVYNLSLVLAFLNSPWVTVLVFATWLLYALKAINFVLTQFDLRQHEFLYYSATGLSKGHQARSWFVVQLAIHAPLIGYGLFSSVIGWLYGYYDVPLMTSFYILALSGISGWVCRVRMNRTVDSDRTSFVEPIIKFGPKPFFSLYLYHLATRLRMPWLITKILSGCTIVGGVLLLRDTLTDHRSLELIILGVVTGHAYLIYESYRFDESFLPFMRNFPIHGTWWYGQHAITYLILLVPELVWLVSYSPGQSIELSLFMIGMLLLFYSTIIGSARFIRPFLTRVFFLFTVFFLVILSGWFLFLTVFSFAASFVALTRFYYRRTSSPVTNG